MPVNISLEPGPRPICLAALLDLRGRPIHLRLVSGTGRAARQSYDL
jgi:hypothetical protein